MRRDQHHRLVLPLLMAFASKPCTAHRWARTKLAKCALKTARSVLLNIKCASLCDEVRESATLCGTLNAVSHLRPPHTSIVATPGRHLLLIYVVIFQVWVLAQQRNPAVASRVGRPAPADSWLLAQPEVFEFCSAPLLRFKQS